MSATVFEEGSKTPKMSTVCVSLPDELLYDDLSGPVINVSEEVSKLDQQSFDIADVLVGGRPATKPSPGHESVASDVTMDSAIADMMGSPAGSLVEGLESGEENVTDVVGLGSDAADISTIDFNDMLDDGYDNDELMFLNYLLDDDNSGTQAASPISSASRSSVSSEGSPESSLVEKPVVTPPLTRVSTRQGKVTQQLQAANFQTQQEPSTSKSGNVVLKVVVPKATYGPKRPAVRGKVGPDDLDEETMERNKKNAIQAKINRQKKKAYVEDLELKVSSLARENDSLKKESKKLVKEKSSLEEEVAYLRSVLANQSALSGLLKNIENVQNVRLTSSFSRKRSADLDHDYGEKPAVKKPKRSAVPAVSGGVCLHVDKNDVSIEFCHHCAKRSKGVEDGE